MKFYYYLVAAIVLLVGCSDEDDNSEFNGSASAIVNGTLWQFPILVADNRVNPTDSLLLAITHSSSQDGEVFKALSITGVKPTFALQRITVQDFYCAQNCPVMGGYFTTLESDVIGDEYNVDTTAINNFIQITGYDSRKAEISGTFNISFVIIKDDGEGETPPERLEFKEGKFTARVKREWFE